MLILLLVLIAAVSCSSVVTKIKAQWSKPSFFAQAGEFFSQFGENEYYNFIDYLADAKGDPYSYCDQFHPESGELLKLAYETGVYAPKIAAFNSFVPAEHFGCEGLLIESSAGYKCLLKTSEIESYNVNVTTVPFDHLKESSPKLIVYLNFSNISKLYKSINVPFIVRPLETQDTTDRMLINGYGATLMVKSTEYKVIDDTKYSKGSRIVSKRESEFDDFLANSNFTSGKISDLSMKAVQMIIDAEDPFKMLRTISYNFPAVSQKIQEQKLTRVIAPAFEEKNLLTLNNRLVNTKLLNIFNIQNFIVQYYAHIVSYKRFGLSIHDANEMILKYQKYQNDFSTRFNLTNVLYLNNVEKDKRYAQFPDNLIWVLQYTQPGRLAQVRRNVFTVIILFDPEFHLKYIEDFVNNIKMNIPIRFGIVPLVKPSTMGLCRKLASTKNVREVVSVLNEYEEKGKVEDVELDGEGEALLQSWISQTARFKTPAMFCNGRRLELPVQYSQNYRHEIMSFYIYEVRFLRENIADISAGVDILQYVLSQNIALDWYDNEVLEGTPQFDPKLHIRFSDFSVTLYTKDAAYTNLNITDLEVISDDRNIIAINGRVLKLNFGAEILPNVIEYEKAVRAPSKFVQYLDQFKRYQELLPFITESAHKKLYYANDLLGDLLESGYIEIPKTTAKITLNSNKNPIFHFEYLLDPLSKSVQYTIGVLNSLKDIPFVAIDIYLNPNSATEPPNYLYRYVDKEYAVFNHLPPNVLFTLGIEENKSWLVVSEESEVDLDNIIDTDVDSVYALKNILIEGHCIDSYKEPPRGLEFELERNGKVIDDTIVMANFGYFQLKANPGAFELKLRPKSKSEEIYNLESDSRIYVTSMEGITLFPEVKLKPHRSFEELHESSSMWGKVSGMFKKTKINIFSVASGHLYERFLRIMILSVLRHTKSPVKFWFIENFLSPMFKKTIGLMAEKFNFEYELVTFKWPVWLREQTEKQRIIWGYKILFLDVLFPLDLEKVIFVDADQIVRTDMKELVELNLHGAPYGYTPFCNSRKGMDRFRFWETGYWKSLLGNKPYHISALYVVDLVKFRKMAAGDKLRQQYHMLSADPNSLANLDQDLPNNLIYEVPIFSLPKEWLWCETWCDDESLKVAKTIDLCNNPLTKEPKLERASRLIPEWKEYDKIATDFIREALQEKETRSSKVSTEHSEL